MPDIAELRRLASPAPRPQSIAFDGATLWLGSRETRRVYAIDHATWTVRADWEAPGTPWGMTLVGSGELRVVCGEGAEDDRFIRRFTAANGFDGNFSIPCPDNTGSQIAFNGVHLLLSQWYNQRVLALDASGATVRAHPVPHQICGVVFAQGAIHCVTTDDEETNDYWLTRIDPNTGTTTDLARIPFAARALAFDGTHFWTNHREQNELVCFAVGA